MFKSSLLNQTLWLFFLAMFCFEKLNCVHRFCQDVQRKQGEGDTATMRVHTKLARVCRRMAKFCCARVGTLQTDVLLLTARMAERFTNRSSMKTSTFKRRPRMIPRSACGQNACSIITRRRAVGQFMTSSPLLATSCVIAQRHQGAVVRSLLATGVGSRFSAPVRKQTHLFVTPLCFAEYRFHMGPHIKCDGHSGVHVGWYAI